MFIESHEEDGVHWIVSLDGSPNPTKEDSVECTTREDAQKMSDFLEKIKEPLK